MLEAVQELEDLTVNDLYAEYPDFLINVDREQDLLSSHERVVIQHPFFWYSTPAIVKEWFDLVLEYGWAYGNGGDALKGKSLLSAVTTGGGKEAYCPEGHNCYTVEEFLRPIEQTARLCEMEWEKPFVVHGALALNEEALQKAAADYRARLTESDS